MAILTMEVRGVRGLGDVAPGMFAVMQPDTTAAIARVLRENPAMANPPPPVEEPSFLETWGPRLGAGAAGLAIGFVIAKLARRKRG